MRGCFAQRGDSFFVEGRVGDDSGGGDVLAGKFELRLHQDEEIGAPFCGSHSGRQDFSYGDERDVEDDEIDWFGDVVSSQVARIARDANDAAVVAQLPG